MRARAVNELWHTRTALYAALPASAHRIGHVFLPCVTPPVQQNHAPRWQVRSNPETKTSLKLDFNLFLPQSSRNLKGNKIDTV